MAALVKAIKYTGRISNKNTIIYNIARNHWNKDWKPGPVPITPEEFAQAAKKYNLPVEEYRPYPDDGLGHGDYPKLPDISGDSKDPWYPYDFPEHKRNFNEPLHVDADMYGEDRFDVSAKFRYSITTQLLAFVGVVGSLAALYYWLDDKRMFRPVLPKQLPGDGRVHYTFEPKD